MFVDAHCSPAATATEQLAIVVRELESIIAPLCAALAQARALDSATQWQSKTAEAFHLMAEDWAHDLSRLGVLAYEGVGDVRRAHEHAAFAAWACE